jgi:hypothetical protein
VADQPAVAVHHGVDRAHRPRFVRQRVQQRDHRLLAGVGDVQPGKAHGARGVQQHRQRLGALAATVQVDQLVVQAQALGGAPLLPASPGVSERWMPAPIRPMHLR